MVRLCLNWVVKGQLGVAGDALQVLAEIRHLDIEPRNYHIEQAGDGDRVRCDSQAVLTQHGKHILAHRRAGSMQTLVATTSLLRSTRASW